MRRPNTTAQRAGHFAVFVLGTGSDCIILHLQVASLPLDANVQFVTIMATKMPFVGRG